MNIALILIAGNSSRLKDYIPIKKQFYKINDQELFLYSLHTFFKSSLFDSIYLVIDKDDESQVIDILENNELLDIVRIVYGGKNRNFSTYNGLLAIKQDYPYELDQINVFVHDGARPLVSLNLLSKLDTELKTHDNCIPYSQVFSSLFDLKDNCYVNRNQFKTIQTPEAFNFNLLWDAMNNIDLNSDEFLDEGSIILANNKPLHFIEGEFNNIKVSDIQSLKLVEELLKWMK